MTPTIIEGQNYQIRVGDVRAGLASLEPGSVHCGITSPPYWGLRDYGFDGQIGNEKTPDEFVATMVDVFRGVKRVLRDDGVLFVNLGDSYATGAGSASNPGSRVYGKRNGHIDGSVVPLCQPNRMDIGIAAGNLIGIPWRVAFALQADGWVLRQCIVWNKRSPMPESVRGVQWKRCRVKVQSQRSPKEAGLYAHGSGNVRARPGSGGVTGTMPEEFQTKWAPCPGCDKCRDNGGYVLKRGSWRPTTSHEFIFMFVKSSRYFCDGDSSQEEATGQAPGNKTHKHTEAYKAGDEKHRTKAGLCEVEARDTRNMRSVWTLSSEPFKGAHFACYPTELVRRCLSAATSRGGCCSACGAQYGPVVETERVATRPGTGTKVNAGSDVVGNRDPQRHTTTTTISGFKPTCTCNAPPARPVVLDCFSGSGTTGQVAINMGCDYIGLEANSDYVELSRKRIQTPWRPRTEKTKKQKISVKRKRVGAARSLFE